MVSLSRIHACVSKEVLLRLIYRGMDFPQATEISARQARWTMNINTVRTGLSLYGETDIVVTFHVQS